MAKKVKTTAPRKAPAPKLPKVNAGELVTLLDYLR